MGIHTERRSGMRRALPTRMSNIVSTTVLLAAACLGGCATAPQSTASASTPDSIESASSGSPQQAPRIVQGDLDITNRTSLEVFDEVEIVTGTLAIVGNTRLRNLDGLENLRTVKNLVITENVNLQNMEGLSG